MQRSYPNDIFRWKQKPLILVTYGLLVSTSAFLSARSVFLIPADPKNNIFLGFSLPRLIFVGVVFVTGILSAGFALKAFRDHAWVGQVWRSLFEREERARLVRWASAGGLFFGLMLSFMPAYRFGNFQDYFIRAHPLMIWLAFVCALTFVVSWVEKYGFSWRRINDMSHTPAKVWKTAVVVLALFALVWLLIARTGLGITVVEDYWFGAGVPILGLQILIALLAGIGVFFLEKRRLPFQSRMDLLAFFLLWGLAAFLWVREPLPPSYFAPGPYPPGHEYYPYSDAAFFDLSSQFALIGQGLNNGLFVGRALYMQFLLLLHALAGQDYIRVVAWQAGIYAVFPAILYLLGKEIHSRSFGVMLAVLAMLRGVNGIAASTMINLANQKQMLTDFPTAIFVALFAYMVVRWLKAPGRNYPYALWVGGVVGLGSMIRTNALFLFLFALFLVFIIYKQWRHRLIVSFLLGVALLAAIIPWGMQSGGSFFNVYLQGIRSVIEQRYHLNPPPSTPTPSSQGNISPSSRLCRGQETVQTVSLSAASPTSLVGREPASGSFIDFQQPAELQGGETESRPIMTFVSTHFLHNIITSVFSLPMSPILHDLNHTIKETGPFWEEYWDGNFESGVVIFLMLDLLLIALGIGTAWGSNGLPGLVPLGAFLFYGLANGFARTSGGRYIVPIDWIVLLYFSFGLLQVALWGISLFGSQGFSMKKDAEDPMEQTPWTWKPLQRAPWIVLIFLLIGTSLSLSDRFFPRRYPVQSQSEILTSLEEAGHLQEIGFDRAVLDAVSTQWPAFDVTMGRALYPRFYLSNKGEPKASYPYGVLDFPRMAFTLIGPNGLNTVLLPEDQVSYFPNAVDVIVLGCKEGSHIDALAVVVIADQTVTYVREPASPIQCPLQQPVCDENHTCR